MSLSQNVDEETKGSSMASKQDFEAPSDNGASSSKQNPEVPKSASGELSCDSICSCFSVIILIFVCD